MIMQSTVTIKDQVYLVEQVAGKVVSLKRYDKKSKFWVELVFSDSETDVHADLQERLEAAYIEQVLQGVES